MHRQVDAVAGRGRELDTAAGGKATGRQGIEAEREGGTRGQQRVEHVDGEIAADAAIDEPKPAQYDLAIAAGMSGEDGTGNIAGPHGYGAEQQGEAQAHAGRHG